MPTTADPNAEPSDSFLNGQWLGLSRWMWISIALALVLALIPRGARRAIESNTNKAEDWLPDSYAESADLKWFRQHFVGENFVLLSWDGCTLGNDEKLRLLKQKLLAVQDERGPWFPRVVTGPETIESLTQAPASLERYQAIKRLEGALVGPAQMGTDGESLGDPSRTTCMLAFLSDAVTENNLDMRRAVERIAAIASTECGIPSETLHMGGPPVDNITIDIEGEKTLLRLALLSGLVGLTLSYLCFRSWPLTGMVFFAAVVNAGMSLALVFYYSVIEVLALGMEKPLLGKTDAIMMSMPAVVYVLGLSGAIHLVNYYRDERRERGKKGAVEHAVSVAWGPCLLAALTTAVGLGSLAASDILPIRKFGLFTASGVVVGVVLLFALIPILLHCFPPSDEVINQRKKKNRDKLASDRPWYASLSEFVTTRHALTTVLSLLLMGWLAIGLTKIETRVQLLKLLDSKCDLITDYEWLEQNMGNLVPMEVIVALGPDRLRTPDDPAQLAEGQPYRMTLYERNELIDEVRREIESLAPVSRALSAATFAAPTVETTGSANVRRSAERVVSTAMEDHRESLYEYLKFEEDTNGNRTGRELWRISARVTALGDIDYGQFVTALKAKVEPVLTAYRARDELAAELAAESTTLRDARLLLLFNGNEEQNAPAPGSDADRLLQLLRKSSKDARQVACRNIKQYELASDSLQERFLKSLDSRDAVVTLDRELVNSKFAKDGAELLLLASAPPEGRVIEGGPITAAVYTGIVPLVYKTQRELLISLRESIGWATLLIGCVMVVVLRSPAAGLASMIPNLFPIVSVFGALGWMGIKVDIGIMMTASVALGVAVDDTLHFVTWFGRGIRQGLDRQSATRMAYERCATAMLQTTLIAGLGLAVFAVSTFTPTQQFGSLMITMLGAALIGDLILLPALLCGPLGRFFAPGAKATPDKLDIEPAEVIPEEEPTDVNTESVIIPFPAPSEEPCNEPIVEESDPEEPLTPENEALRQKLRSFRRSGE